MIASTEHFAGIAGPCVGRVLPIALLLALVTAASLPGQVIRVPADQPTIQKALDAAGAGTTILVAAGTYRENLVWPVVDGLRLVAVEGPGRTVLQASGLQPAVTFPAGLGRATLLEGFAVQGAATGTTGPGLHISSSPTIRSNEIRGFRTRTAGGGLVITGGGQPLIDRNLIQWNESEVSGAGVFVGRGASPLLRGNRILTNALATSTNPPAPLVGAGLHVNTDAGSGILVAGNVIAGNWVYHVWAHGGGVALEGGSVDVINNTIAGNGLAVVMHPHYGGGGIYLGKCASVGHFRLFNNIVFQNWETGIFREASGSTPVADHNDVWSNRGGNYVNVTPGPHDLAVDPGLAGAADYHLSPSSPLVDAGLNLVEGQKAGLDLDGDPRFVDGRWLGGLAVSDVGADEYDPARLHVQGTASPGHAIALGVDGPGGSSHALFLSTQTANTLIQPFGQLLVQPLVLLETGAVPARSTWGVPALPALEGVHVHVQALVTTPGPTGIAGAFTNRVDLLLGSRTRALVETFRDTFHLDRASTTARWGSGLGGAGLTAAYGYGGDGSDGVLDVSTIHTLDASTRPAGPDGVVVWNFQSVLVRLGATLVLTGSRPIRIHVQESCSVDGTMRLSGRNGLNAPPGAAGTVGRLAGGAGGPGGGAGGDANTNPTAQLGALPLDLRGGPGWPRAGWCGEVNRSENRTITVLEPNCGGGAGGNRGVPSGYVPRNGCAGNGGGHFSDGFQTDWLCGNVGSFGWNPGLQWITAVGPLELTGPTGGAGGGAGGNAAWNVYNPVPVDDVVAGSGGGAGGGLEIVTFENLVVNGVICADGGNGGMGWSTVVSGSTVSGGWGAGGAGGSIWLSGTSVVVAPTARVTAVGGEGNPNPPHLSRSGHGGYGLVVVRDRGGDPSTTPSYIVPAPLAGRALFDPPGNGKSEAVSLFYDSGTANPAWAFDASDPGTGEVRPGSDLVFLTPPASGQKVFIEFQGAPDSQGRPHPNPATWVPPNGYTPDIADLRGKQLRHLRFRIRFELGKRRKGSPPPPVFTLKEVRIRY